MLKEQIRQDLNKAIKTKEELAISVLRMFFAAVLNKEKEKRYKSGEKKEIALTEEEMIEVISSEVKKRKEASAEYEKANRADLAEKELKEAAILQKYLPAQLLEEEVEKLVREAIKKTGAKEQKDMGKVMSVLMTQIKGRADGSLVSKIVKNLLTS